MAGAGEDGVPLELSVEGVPTVPELGGSSLQ